MNAGLKSRPFLVLLICALSTTPLLLGACSSDSGSTEGSATSDTFSPGDGDGAEDSQSEAASTFENGVLTTPDERIEITRHKVIGKGEKGNEIGEKPVLAFWFKTTNLSGEETAPSIAFVSRFSAYQDTNPNAENELNVGALPDDRFLESQTENIKKGRTVESAMAYELDDLATPVELRATENLDQVVGTATYNLK